MNPSEEIPLFNVLQDTAEKSSLTITISITRHQQILSKFAEFLVTKLLTKTLLKYQPQTNF